MDVSMNTVPCGYVAFADDGTVVEINLTLAEMLGYTRVELLGWHVEKLLPPGGRIFYHTHVFPLLKLQGAVEEIYLALRTKDGHDVPVLLNGVRRQQGDRYISECVFMRMLQRHQYEEQLLEARRLAEEANAAKAKFLSMMSHDLRTPLTSISGHADLLRRAMLGPLTDEQTEAAESIAEAAHVLMRMITDILDFAQLDSGHVQVMPTSVPLREAIARAQSLVRVPLQAASLELTGQSCDDDTAALADAGKLQQILLNLLTNAIKFTPPGGTITLQCERTGERVRITVRDTGIGIRDEDLQRIFSPFVQIAPSTEHHDGQAALPPHGVGLGLAISRDLARAMGGDVTAISTPGQGSVFTVELPASEAMA
jgi:PAS domain S-box-containing protein